MVQQLLTEKKDSYICDVTKHSWRLVKPIWKVDKKQEVRIKCTECNEEDWRYLTEAKYKRFLKDLKDGKIR
jgi:ribosomal protein L44E